MIKHNLPLLFVGLAACGTDSTQDHVPSASVTPHTRSLTTAQACGEDVALYGAATPDLRLAFTYNGDGYLTHIDGAFTAGGANETIDYAYDSALRFTHMLENHGFGDTKTEITETYDGDNLATYAYATASTDYTDSWQYAYSDFLGPWQPQREVVAEQGQPSFGYALGYDTLGRLISATPDSGPATTYAYDDTGRTISSDTGNGAWTYVTTYNADWNEASEAWGGSDPSAIAGDYTLNWDGDSLVSEVYRSGTEDAPTDIQLVETDTVRYDCSTARKGASPMFRARAPRQSAK